MRSVRMRSGASPLGLPSLFFIYALIGILGTLASKAFFDQALSSGRVVPSLVWVLFLSIPIGLLAFLVSALVRLVRDAAARRGGAKLRARLFWLFMAAAALASLPPLFIASRFVSGVVDSWYSSGLSEALVDASALAADAYRSRLRLLERTVSAGGPAVEEALAGGAYAVQVFGPGPDGTLRERSFRGEKGFALPSAPAGAPGFLAREPGRDRDLVRCLARGADGSVAVHTLSLGVGFDERIARIEAAQARAESVARLRPTLVRTLLLFYAAFLLPTLLMTLLIAYSLSDSVARPLVGLAEATRRVASGDFSMRLGAGADDELGALTSSFNAMVRELEGSRAALLETEKKNLWQDMAQRLAHEIKNPLTPIKLSAERVLRRWRSDPERLAEILEPCMLSIVQEVDGLTNLLGEFRSFARLPPPTLERVNLRRVVEGAAALYRSSYPQVRFVYSEVDPDLELEADRRHLSQALSNLIVNAVDAMAGAGVIEFGASLVKKDDCRYCRISVRDNGKGIPENQLLQVFTPYFTTKASGTGLGLSIVERIVADHGGSVWVESAEGAGATFRMDLPVTRKT